jgi:hypothetical protein
VRLSVDSRGYIKALEVLEEARSQPATLTHRDETIARLAVLKVAAHFAANKDLKSGDVLAIAERWLAWINQ